MGARAGVGTIADSFVNSLAETTNGPYKAECVGGCPPLAAAAPC